MAFNGARAFDSLRPRFPVAGNFSLILRSGQVLERFDSNVVKGNE